MGRRAYADVRWLWWLRQTGIDVLKEASPPDYWRSSRPERSIMDRCIAVPAAYWPQVVDEECAKLLAAGMDRERVKRVRQWLERELTI